ncbi:glycosyltransferase family 4 protein [Actinopolymorpha alba]|uniref:glycosyltransferase family 4 protein n=1 Tax=Actinopolymorpha alba TaxID=533267 RepID=UPI00037ACE38|nr:glycosyltransferase family 4 protein [Actinopolymorpha alba]
MRIVAYSNEYMPDGRWGAQKALRDLLRPLTDPHEVSVVCWDGHGLSDPYEWEGARVLPDKDSPESVERLRSADLLITHLMGTFFTTDVGETYDIPVVQLIHGNFPGDTGEHGFLRRRCDLAIFNSHWLSAEFPEYTRPRLVTYPLIDPAEYRTQPGPAVTLVNLGPWKGSDIFYALAEEFPDVPFLGVLGYDEPDVRDLPNVTVSPSVDDMRPVYSQTRILLMPSKSESFGRCAVEAAASGIPTIAAPTDGLREALGDAGTFCPTDDLDAWKSALSRLLQPEGWEEASSRALARSTELAEITKGHLEQWREAVDAFEAAQATS